MYQFDLAAELILLQNFIMIVKGVGNILKTDSGENSVTQIVYTSVCNRLLVLNIRSCN